MSDQTQLQARIEETIRTIKDALTELGLNVIDIEPCPESERIREGDELMPHFSAGHFNGWFQVSSKKGNFKIGFMAESIPVLDLLGTEVTAKEILENMPRKEQFNDDNINNDCSGLYNLMPLMDDRVLEVFIRLFKNRQR